MSGGAARAYDMKMFILCCLSGFLFAQGGSNRPSPAPTKAAQANQNQTGVEQREAKNQGPPIPRAARGDTKAGVAEKQNASNNDKQKPSRDWWTIINAWMVPIFTGLLAFLAHRQRQAMDRQAGYMRDGLALTRCSANAASLSAQAAQRSVEMARLEQRAWVGVHAVSNLVLRTQAPSSALVLIKNTGRTPARNITISTFFEVVDGIKTNWSVTESNEPDATLPPDTEFSISRAAETALSQSAINAINGGRSRLYFWGLIQYRIMDESMHTTGFSFLYNHEVSSFQRCAGFNDAD